MLIEKEHDQDQDHEQEEADRDLAPEVGFVAVIPCIWLQLSSLHPGNQANSPTTLANSVTAVCWQFCWQPLMMSDMQRQPWTHCRREHEVAREKSMSSVYDLAL
jgi:hypothetical protein